MISNRTSNIEEVYVRIEEFTLIYIQILTAVVFSCISLIFSNKSTTLKEKYTFIDINMLSTIFVIILIIIYFVIIIFSWLILFTYKTKYDEEKSKKLDKLQKCSHYYEYIKHLIIIEMIVSMLITVFIVLLVY